MQLTINEALAKGLKAHKSNKVEEAEEFYNIILKEYPNHIHANINMAMLLSDSQQSAQALPFYKKAIASEPSNASHWLGLIKTLVKLRKLSDASIELENSEKVGIIDPNLDLIKRSLQQENLLHQDI